MQRYTLAILWRMTAMFETGRKLLSEIISKGYNAYIVGGTVRDIAMNCKDIHDVDIATNMPIDAIKKSYKTVEYGGGEKHGTVIVVFENLTFELTQFRCDGIYTDGRRPDNVQFVNDFKTDCSRRDFTINAMGMDADGNIVDYFNGIEDIKNRVIKTVGKPFDRFKEDALRMVRACRFAGRFDFEIETQVGVAIKNHKHLVANVSKERILDEFKKASSYGSKAFRKFIIYMHTTGLLNIIIPGGLSRDFHKVMSALQDCHYNDFNLHLSIILFGCGDEVKNNLKLSNENWEAIKFVNENYVYLSLLDQLSRTRAYEMCSHKHFKILKYAYLAYEKKTALQDVIIPYILEYKDAYEQQSIISDEMLKTVKPSKTFGFMKREMLESHLYDFEIHKKLRSEEEIRKWVNGWLETDMIWGELCK